MGACAHGNWPGKKSEIILLNKCIYWVNNSKYSDGRTYG